MINSPTCRPTRLQIGMALWLVLPLILFNLVPLVRHPGCWTMVAFSVVLVLSLPVGPVAHGRPWLRHSTVFADRFWIDGGRSAVGLPNTERYRPTSRRPARGWPISSR